MTTNQKSLARDRVVGVCTLVLVAAMSAANAAVAIAQTDIRIVGISQAQWDNDRQTTNKTEIQNQPIYTAMADLVRQSSPSVEHQQQNVDLFANLYEAANTATPATTDFTQPIATSIPTKPEARRPAALARPVATETLRPAASLPAHNDITPITPVQVQSVRLAERQPEPAPQHTKAVSASPSTSEPPPAPTEAIAVPAKPEEVQESIAVPSQNAAVKRMGPCEPGTFLYGCPYYPTQSGTRIICGVDCGSRGAPCCATWNDTRPIPWSLFGPGEYVGPPRIEHVSTYYLRVNDLLTLTYILSRKKNPEHYRIGVGDRLRIESKTDETLDREVQVQPDGVIELPLIGDVDAAGRTVKDLTDDLVRRFSRIEQQPLITVTPIDVNNALQEIIKAVTSQSRSSGQALDLRVTPEGTIQAPGIGSVYVQGLTLEEVRSELEARYAATFGPGLLVSPSLTERATSYVFVGGEVKTPGRYTLEGPTTVMQAIALAGGFNNGGNLREVVVFRRDENWCLKATRINIYGPLYGKDPCPVNDVWLRDNDLVIVPKQRILCADDVIELYFTRGVYAVFPITFVKDFAQGSTTVIPVP